MEKILNVVAGILGALTVGSGLVALSFTHVASDPSVPDIATGHTIAFDLRGAGRVYLTQQEWDAIAPYWNTLYVVLGLFVASIFVRVGHMAYQGFMRGWRSDD